MNVKIIHLFLLSPLNPKDKKRRQTNRPPKKKKKKKMCSRGNQYSVFKVLTSLFLILFLHSVASLSARLDTSTLPWPSSRRPAKPRRRRLVTMTTCTTHRRADLYAFLLSCTHKHGPRQCFVLQWGLWHGCAFSLGIHIDNFFF